jgi:hypothetical protein
MSQLCTSISIGRTSEVGHFREPKKVYHVIVLVLCVLAVIVSLLLQHEGDELRLFGIRWPVSCALYEHFGIRCALCGLTRSCCAMGAGELSAAARFHPLGPGIFVFVCLQIPYRIHALWATRVEKRRPNVAGVLLAIGLAGALLINWFVYLGGLML